MINFMDKFSMSLWYGSQFVWNSLSYSKYSVFTKIYLHREKQANIYALQIMYLKEYIKFHIQ